MPYSILAREDHVLLVREMVVTKALPSMWRILMEHKRLSSKQIEMDNIITIQHPEEFKDGVRILMRTLRSKEGGKVNKPDRVAEKVVSRNREEFDKIFAHLMSKREGQERIYSTVDERDMDKAIRLFKYRQLDSDYFDKESRNSFYTDIFNRWISALQAPESRKGTLFMVDVDNDKETGDETPKILNEIVRESIEIVHEYPTKNGRHLILKPFNPSIVNFSVQKNGMMLWVYNNDKPE